MNVFRCGRLGMMQADEMSVDSRVVSREAKGKEARTRTSVCVWWSVKCSGDRARACVYVRGLWCSSVEGGG